jgi:hypothetical protein
MIISSNMDGGAGVGKVRHMLGINMLEERPIPDQADAFSVSMAQSGFPKLPSSASASSVLSSNSSGSPGEIMILMQVVSGTIVSASCSDVSMAEGLDLQLGGLFKNNLRDQEAWDNEIDATMRQIISGEGTTPLDLPLGPMLFKREKKKRRRGSASEQANKNRIMNVTVNFPEFSPVDDDVRSYRLAIHIKKRASRSI